MHVHTTKIQTEQSENHGNSTLVSLFCSGVLLSTHLLISFADFTSYTLSISSGLCHWAHRTGLNIHRENYI